MWKEPAGLRLLSSETESEEEQIRITSSKSQQRKHCHLPPQSCNTCSAMGWVFCTSKGPQAWAIYLDTFILWSFLNDSFKGKDSVWQTPNKWVNQNLLFNQPRNPSTLPLMLSVQIFSAQGTYYPSTSGTCPHWGHRPLPGTQSNFFPKMLMWWGKNSNFFSLRNTG